MNGHQTQGLSLSLSVSLSFNISAQRPTDADDGATQLMLASMTNIRASYDSDMTHIKLDAPHSERNVTAIVNHVIDCVDE